MMQKGTAIVGFFLSFMLGMFVMYGVNKSNSVDVSAEPEAVAAKADDSSDSPIPVGADDPQWGKADALVTVVEISDFQCPFCSRVNATMDKIKETYGPEKVRIVWKHNPLPFHKQARPAHEASQAVFDLGGSEAFWKFHDAAFENQKALTPENFEKWAGEAGVDVAKFKAAIKDKKYSAKVEKDLASNRKIGATGTPAFRINGVTLSGAQPFERFKSAIDEQVKAAEALLKKGTKRSEISVALTKQNYKEAPEPSKKDQAPPEDTTVWKVPVMSDDPVMGPKDALVTIVEWSDFQCPFCGRVNPTLEQLIKDYPKDVRVVWKDNPLPFHKQAKPAAALARAAYKQGGDALFWKAHALIFENQKKLTEPGIFATLGAQLGLPAGAVTDAALEDKAVAEQIAASQELAMDLNARGTPHFFINGRRLSGAQPLPAFKKLVDEQLKIAQDLVKKGTPAAQVYETIMKTAKGPPEPEKREVPAPGKDNPVKGKANAKVVIQEFSDFQCPYCARVNPTIKQVLKEYDGQVQIVWRNMPLAFHKDAPLAAQAAQEAFAQKGSEGFWKFHDKLFDNQKEIQREHLEKYATELGLDMTAFKKALDEETHKKHIDADMEVAKKAGVSGTPAFTVNGYFISGAQPYPKFQKLINLALKEAK